MNILNQFAAGRTELSNFVRESALSGEPADARTIGGLIGDLMIYTGEFDVDPAEFLDETDPVLAAATQARLHDILKARYLGEIFDFTPFAVWVDANTPVGTVNIRVTLDPDTSPA
jgi:hypothetical protein